MRRKSIDFYDEYKDYDVTFTKKIIDNLGLVIGGNSFKCGGEKYLCIIYSSTMKGARIIAGLNDDFFESMKRKRKTIVLRFTFIPPGQRQEVSFIINSKILKCTKYSSEKPGFYFINVEYINKAPNILIEILGNHITRQLTSQKRMEERIVLGTEEDEALGIKLMDNYLFISGNAIKCALTEISVFSAKVLINGKGDQLKSGTNVLLLMRAKGLDKVGEMVGSIERIDLIGDYDEFYSVIINFNQDLIPPTYKMWIGECIEMIKIRHKRS